MIHLDKCLERGCPTAQSLVEAGLDEGTINDAAERSSYGIETYCANAKDEQPGTCGTDIRREHVLRALVLGVRLGQEMAAQAPQPVNLESAAV